MSAVNPDTARNQGVPSDASLQLVRNVGIAAHIDAGKTTLTERILLYTGAIHKAGNVDEGNTTTDFDPEERRRGITIFAAAVSCEWTQQPQQALTHTFPGVTHRLNLIDTPGHVDFTAEVERSLRVLDGLIAVFCGVAGVQPQSETVWRQANRYGVPRLVFVNKMDRVGADFMRVVSELQEKLSANAWPIILPLGREDQLTGQIDVINERAFLFDGDPGSPYTVTDVPAESRELVASVRSDLVAKIADLDDEVATFWLSNEPVPTNVLKAAIRRATVANRFVPVVGGSAYRYVGVQPLLDAVVDYLPGPLDAGTVLAHADRGAQHKVELKTAGAPVALAFKVAHDPQARRMVFLRVYAGRLSRGARVLNSRTGKRERVGRLMRVFADRLEEVDDAWPGEIVASDLKLFRTGDTLCDPAHPLQLEPPVFPEPVVNMAVEPRWTRDRDKLARALTILSEEDPTFRTFSNPETGQSIIAGMGELHLEIIRQKLEQEHGVSVSAGAPAIAYRETISTSAQAEHLFERQTGNVNMFAQVSLAVRPNERGQGFSVDSRVTGGKIPAEFMEAVREGARDGLQGGVLAGYPVVDVHVDILDGEAHAKDSSEDAFRMAAFAATREALEKAGPILLEPIMKLELDAPPDQQGDLMGDLTRRRANILAVDSGPTHVLLKAHVPLAELWGYANAVRSLSRGRASYNMSPSHFDRVPDALAEKIVSSMGGYRPGT